MTTSMIPGSAKACLECQEQVLRRDITVIALLESARAGWEEHETREQQEKRLADIQSHINQAVARVRAYSEMLYQCGREEANHDQR